MNVTNSERASTYKSCLYCSTFVKFTSGQIVYTSQPISAVFEATQVYIY